MTQRVNIVTAVPEDMKRLSEIAEVCFPDPWSEKLFTEAYNSPYSEIVLAKTDSGEIAGYLVLSDSGDEKSVDDIAVLPEYRRAGIARTLLESAHGRYTGQSFILEVRESNAPAIALYNSLGYEQVGFRKRYYRNPDEGAVLMTRTART